MRLIIVKSLLFLLALLVAVILVAPQVDLDPILPAKQAGSLMALLLILAVVTRAASPLALSSLTASRYHRESIISGSRGSTFFPLRC